jgi:alpha 1,2-mannosyltransferase
VIARTPPVIPERMRSRIRILASAIILLVIVFSLFYWNQWEANENPDYLPTGADDSSQESQPDETRKSQLANVVEEFVKRPILSYEESVELNSKTCPTEGVNFDEGAVTESKKKWRHLTSYKIAAWREGIAAHLYQREREKQEKAKSESSLAKNGQGGETMSGRGIVMSAGDRDAIVRARTNLRFLRSYNCTLAVEIFHFPNELSPPEKSLLQQVSEEQQDGQSGMNVTVRVVEGLKKGIDWKAFHIKAAAIQQSSFDEILYLDTDSYLLRNPEYLFKSKYWKETGLMLWPDYTKSHATNPLWRLLGQKCRNEYEGESGQILISRSLHQDVLWLVEYFALYHHEFYGFTGGDRDSFRAAALLLGKKWTGPGRLNAAAGAVLKRNPQGGGHTMLQADPEGKWMFVHANLIKHAHFKRPIWSQIHRVAQDKFAAGSTYGDIQPPNDKLGDGVKLRVTYEPMMASSMTTFEGYNESLVVVEGWDTYAELKGFEDKWFALGGEH